MHDDVLERFVARLHRSVTGDEVVFSWQGGEPTLMGLEFFEKVVALQKQVREAGPADRERPADQRHAARRGLGAVSQGASLPRRPLASTVRATIHDHYRITKRGEPTFDQVYAAAKMLRRHGVQFNTLTCVNRYNASRPLDVYRFLRREIGSTYMQFIPIVEIRGFETTAPQHWDPARLPVVGDPQRARITRNRS